jgi:hypothetical protein
MTGMAVGNFDETAAGWVLFEALGYVCGYASCLDCLYSFLGPSDGFRTYQTVLTPVGDITFIESGESDTLYLGPIGEPEWEAPVDSSSLDVLPALVTLTEVNPVHVGPLFEEVSTGEDLYLHKAFALCAEDENGNQVQLSGGESITVRVRDNGGLTGALLARFDPETGVWQAVSGGCMRDGAEHLVCQVGEPSSLHGLFHTGEPAYLPAAAGGGGEYRIMSQYGEDFLLALLYLQNILARWERMMENDPGFQPDLNDPDLLDALNDLAEAARQHAQQHPNEQGKGALCRAAQAAELLGKESLSSDLLSEAADVAKAMADDLLQNGDCGRLKEMLKVAEQNEMLGNIDKRNELIEKIKKNVGDCDIWTGEITYWLFIDDTVHGPGLDNMTKQSGPGSWYERHEVRMTTDVLTFVLTGEDWVRLQFPQVKYEDPDVDCEQSMTYWFDQGDPVYLTFGGTYDGVTFSVNNPGSSSQPVNLPYQQVFETMIGENCKTAFEQTLYVQNYSSLLVHGFTSTPPITIQEMLETGTHGENSLFEFIRGHESFSNPNPDDVRFPFIRGHVNWVFRHVEDHLPQEE